MKSTRRSFLKSTAVAGTTSLAAGLVPRAAASTNGSGAATADFWEIVHSRRSVRRFKPEAPVPEADVTKILDAARMAPTSGNQQPWKFLVVRDPAKIQELKEACVAFSLSYFDRNRQQFSQTKEEFTVTTKVSYDSYFSAPVYIVVLTDKRSQYPDYNHYDGPLAASTLMLAARALGYGSVFLTDSIPAPVCRSVLKIPDYYTQVCITPIGVPADWPATPKKKPLADLVAYDSF